MDNPDYIKARNLASEILILQDELFFPINVEKIKLNNENIIFSSYKNYIEKTGISESVLTNNGQFLDSMVFSSSNNLKLILYNSEVSSNGRLLWNKAHEVGHVVLGHKNQGDIQKIEANTFASQLLLPQCLLKKLIEYKLNVTPEYIVSTFGISLQAAKSCLRLVGKKLENDNDAVYDDIILFKCESFLVNELKKSNEIHCFNKEISDEERNNWLNKL